MKIINFSKKYEKMIANNEKICTIRKGIRNFKKGEKVTLCCENKKIGVARIENVVYKTLRSISDVEARKDGFADKSTLKHALKKHYKNISDKDIVTIIHFKLTKKFIKF